MISSEVLAMTITLPHLHACPLLQVRKPGKARRGAAAFARQQQHNPYSLASLLSAAPGSSASVPGLVHQEFAYAAELMVSHRSGGGKAAGEGSLAGRGAAVVRGGQAAGGGAGAAFDRADVAAATTTGGAAGGPHDDGDDDDDGGGGDAGGWDAAGFEDDGDGGGGGGGLDASDVMAGMQGAGGEGDARCEGGYARIIP